MEDLNVKGMMKNRHISKSVQEQGFGYFKAYLKYKCEERNIPLFFVDRWYPSSKTCSCCGFIKKDLKLSDRIYNCPNCGESIDRDYNASINLRNRGQEFYEKSINQAL
jgi:putative transposase